jgi:hypothetical protein
MKREGRYLGEAKASKSLRSLADTTNAVLPSVTGKSDPYNYVFSELKWTPMLGVKSIQSSVHCRNKDTGRTYRCVVDVYDVDPAKTPSYSSNPARVACSCEAYYFYFAKPNEKADAHARARVKAYKPVPLVPGQKRRGPLNPAQIPGMCKHLLAYAELLRDSNYLVP